MAGEDLVRISRIANKVRTSRIAKSQERHNYLRKQHLDALIRTAGTMWWLHYASQRSPISGSCGAGHALLLLLIILNDWQLYY